MRILQVEDDTPAAQAVEQMLKAKGYACETTAYGEQAVEMAQHTPYDLILLDIMLPDIDGYEVLRRLQAAQVATPVVIQSGYIGRVDLQSSVGANVRDYLIKPYTRQELTDRLDAAMDETSRGPDRIQTPPSDQLERRVEQRSDGEARRHHTRMRTLKSAQIVYNSSNCVADCLIVNVSDGGARLKVTDVIDFPENFLLKLRAGPTYRCQLCWQNGQDLGVRFLTP